jgi:hypothetical protein
MKSILGTTNDYGQLQVITYGSVDDTLTVDHKSWNNGDGKATGNSMTWLNASRIHPHGISMDYMLKAKAVPVHATKALRRIAPTDSQPRH